MRASSGTTSAKPSISREAPDKDFSRCSATTTTSRCTFDTVVCEFDTHPDAEVVLRRTLSCARPCREEAIWRLLSPDRGITYDVAHATAGSHGLQHETVTMLLDGLFPELCFQRHHGMHALPLSWTQFSEAERHLATSTVTLSSPGSRRVKLRNRHKRQTQIVIAEPVVRQFFCTCDFIAKHRVA